MKLTINVGLEPSPRYDYLGLSRVDVCNRAWDWILSNLQAASVKLVAEGPTGEPTLVINANVGELPPLNHLASYCGQDCIAATIDGKGELYGAHADLWGPFDPAFFLKD